MAEATITLIALRIPAGWAVTYNDTFANAPFDVRDGQLVHAQSFKEDLLQIRRTRRHGPLEVDFDGWLLDVGWYPSFDPAGHYRLTLVSGGFDNVLLTVQSRNREHIIPAIGRILESPTASESVATLHEAVRNLVESDDERYLRTTAEP